MGQVSGFNVPEAYENMLWYMRERAVREGSRNGDVLTVQEPLILRIDRPIERVLTHPVRNANPFFHALEFVWMIAGRRDAEFVGSLVKRMWDYAEEDGNFHGAYGYRWSEHFDANQITQIIHDLRKDPQSRRAVLTMWDPNEDLLAGQFRDHPCNTHIYFRIVGEALNMTVCNRSNDVIWGMLGANACHMTMLHEVMAHCIGVQMGRYYVVTNNAHIYVDLPNVEELLASPSTPNPYTNDLVPMPILQGEDTYEDFRAACIKFCNDPYSDTGHFWIDNVALPLYAAYTERGDFQQAMQYADLIAADDWRIAAKDWLLRVRG